MPCCLSPFQKDLQKDLRSAMSTDSPDVEALDYRRRRLCPDGSCVGIIGPDGRCGECGAEDPAGPPAGLGPEAFGGGCAADDAGDEAAADAAPAAPAEGGFDPNRTLCPDGACIGVIGADGRCGVCGRAADGPPAGVG